MDIGKRRFALVFAIFICVFLSGPTVVCGWENVPFAVGGLNPMSSPIGFPSALPATIVAPGHAAATTVFSVSNHFTIDSSNDAFVLFDAETHRTDTILRIGIFRRTELAVEIPMVRHTGGFLDGVIDRWHRLIGITGTGREGIPDGRLIYGFSKNGQSRVLFDRPASGIGDLRLSLGTQLPSSRPGRTLAVRVGTKLPTGDPERLTGSGGSSLFLALDGADGSLFPETGLTVNGSMGMMVSEGHSLLEEIRRELTAWGHLGLTWQVSDRLAPMIQLNWYSPPYRNVGLRQMDAWAAAVIFGANWKIRDNMAFQFGMSEDILVDTTPDVTFHFALIQQF